MREVIGKFNTAKIFTNIGGTTVSRNPKAKDCGLSVSSFVRMLIAKETNNHEGR